MLARKIGVSASSLYAYLDGTTLPPPDVLARLLHALDINDVQRERLLDERDAIDGHRRQGRRAPRHPTPVELPPDVARFTGRQAELAMLDELITTDRSTVQIAAIAGIPGVGKTALAVHWAHRNIDRFPDGQLFVNLRGFTPSGAPVTPHAAVRGFLSALGVRPAAVPANLDAQIGLYRSLTAGKHLLILLDNAYDTEQVGSLLPNGSSCTVVITSRNHLSGLRAHAAHLIDLDVLTPDEAHQLLTGHMTERQVTAEPAAITELRTWCAGLPLAINIVAARAVQHRDFPLGMLVDELRDNTTRLDALDAGDPATSVRAVLDSSYHALPDATAAVFRLVGLAPGPDLGLPAAASLAAIPRSRIGKLLRDLETAHLVSQTRPGRFRMHDLVQLYAAERANQDTAEPDRRAALRRLVDFYLHSAHRGDRLLNPHRPPIELEPAVPDCHPQSLSSSTAALAWFDAEKAGIVAAAQAALSHGGMWRRGSWPGP
jgi:hypothetical protein